MNIIKILKQKSDLLHGIGVDQKTISEAERELGLTFADEYKEYLKEMAIVAYSGHELTGLTKSERTNVVQVTRKKKRISPSVPMDWYVIEDANIDGIVIWQDGQGKIYKTLYDSQAVCIASSLVDFINNL